jgi:UDP-glucose 4-epimerase
MRTVVTGAAGFIGSNLVDRLLADGHRVLGLDNLSTGDMVNLEHARGWQGGGGRFTFIRADVQAPELVDIIAGTNPDVVFHLAAQVDVRRSVRDPIYDARHNVLGTINLLEACRRGDVRKIVSAASGGARYGAPAVLPVTETTGVDPLSPYAAAKVASELYLGAYAGMYGLAPISLALANVYGPRQNPHGEAGVVAVFGSAVITGRPTTIYGDGTATRDYVYVDDVVDAFVRAALAPTIITGTFNIGTGRQTSVTELHQMIAAAANGAPPPRYAAARTGEVLASALDSSKAGRELGWKPTVDIADGIQRTIRWLRANLSLEPVGLVEV